jgi:hypothetical protein
VAAAVETTSQHPTAVAVDPDTGRVLVASPGRMVLRHGAPHPSWEIVWEDASARRPIVALAVRSNAIHALRNDGAILEGQTGSPPTKRSPSLADIGDDDDEVTKPDVVR